MEEKQIFYKFKIGETVTIRAPEDGYLFHNGYEGTILRQWGSKRKVYEIDLGGVGPRQFFENELTQDKL